MPTRSVRGEEGVAAVEFAVVLPIFLAILLAVIEFGFALQGQLAVAHAAREGARLAAVNKWDAAAVAARAHPLSGVSVSRNVGPDAVTVIVSFNYVPRIWRVLPTIRLESRAVMRREY